MRNIFLLTANIIRLILRKKITIILFFILPVLGILLSMGLYRGARTGSLRIGIVDTDGGAVAKGLTDAIENTGNHETVNIREDEIKESLLDGSVSVIFKIPPGFTDNISAGKDADIQIVSLKGDEVTVWLERFTNLYLKNISDMASASGGDRLRFDRIYSRFASGSLRFSVEKIEDKSTGKSVTLQSVGFLIMFAMLGTSITSQGMLSEKRSRTYHRICMAPVNARSYVAANVISNMLIVFFQNIVIIFFVMKILGINTFVPDLILLLILMFFGTAAVGLTMMITAFSGSSNQAGALSTLVITPTCMLGGCFWSLDMMPEIMQNISYFVPQKWAIDAIESIQRGGDIGSIAINLVIMIAFAAVFFAISAYRMSVSDNVKRFV